MESSTSESPTSSGDDSGGFAITGCYVTGCSRVTRESVPKQPFANHGLFWDHSRVVPEQPKVAPGLTRELLASNLLVQFRIFHSKKTPKLYQKKSYFFKNNDKIKQNKIQPTISPHRDYRHRINHCRSCSHKPIAATLPLQETTFVRPATLYRCEVGANVLEKRCWGLHKEHK